MRHKKSMLFSSLFTVLIMAGCASPSERELSVKSPSYATLANGHDPLDPNKPSALYSAANATPGDNITRYLEREHGHALNILSLSGGGQNGAFGAGFLVGWRESGQRPEFDVVGA